MVVKNLYSVLAIVLCASGCAQSTGNWTVKSPIPQARNEVALASVGDKVHVIGGGVKGVAGTYHDEYDPATDRWRPRAPLPRGLDHIGTAVLNGRIPSAVSSGQCTETAASCF